MSLYVRVYTNFFTHRKTAKLKALLGPDSHWLPMRLWAYAAEHQPDGNFADYSADELVMLLGYSGNAQAMLQALLQAGFMDSNPLRIHDWEEHNAYHQTYSERGRKAAAARWQKNAERKGKEKKGKETSIASSMLQASESDSEAIERLSWGEKTRRML